MNYATTVLLTITTLCYSRPPAHSVQKNAPIRYPKTDESLFNLPSENPLNQLQQLKARAVDGLVGLGDNAVLRRGQTDRDKFLFCLFARDRCGAEAERGIKAAPPVPSLRCADADPHGQVVAGGKAEAVIGALGVGLGSKQEGDRLRSARHVRRKGCPLRAHAAGARRCRGPGSRSAVGR